jgi:hypothetical protein
MLTLVQRVGNDAKTLRECPLPAQKPAPRGLWPSGRWGCRSGERLDARSCPKF